MLRLDGFASLAASFDGGRVTTRPFAVNGNELWVNAKADYGQLTVELLDGEEKPIPGYAAEDCVALAEDGVAIPVRWRGDGGLNALGVTGWHDFPDLLQLGRDYFLIDKE